MRIFIEGVRGFRDPTYIDITPITLITGENSSGKSTLLAILNVVALPGFPFSPDIFNTAPFELGNFFTITSRVDKRTSGKSRSEFTIGREDERGTVKATYAEIGGQPGLVRLQLVAPKKVQGDSSASGRKLPPGIEITVRAQVGQWIVDVAASGETHSLSVARPVGIEWQPIDESVSYELFRARERDRYSQTAEWFDQLLWMLFRRGRAILTPVALAPVRTKPRRTYDQLRVEFDPEGAHIPRVLATLWHQDSPRSKRLRDVLATFGSQSGLFSAIDVKELGSKSFADPFQILLKSGIPGVNLADLGYGVSQVLPVIVECALQDRTNLVLVQQPEVHLHPRAQAALGTFFVGMASSRRHFVLETHSDQLIDRIRIEVRKKRIKQDDVSLLFLERDGIGTVTHLIKFDQLGNVLGAPESYRQFFIDEQMSMLGMMSSSDS